MQEFQDLETVEKVKNGDVDAYGLLVEKYKQRIYYTAYHFTGLHDDADELSQDAFVKAFENINKFKGMSSFYTWLVRITINLCKNYVASKSYTSSVSLDETINIDYEAERNYLVQHHTKNPLTELVLKETHEKINNSMQRLPSDQRIALILSVFEDLSHKEIAELEGCSEKTISWRIFEARKKLKEELKDYFSGGE